MTYRFHGIFVAIALVLSAGIAQAQEATGDLVPYVDTQLVGFTSTTVTGDAGVLGMLNACHIEFPASRMCTSDEVMNTVAMPVLPSETSAWVRPVYQPGGNSVPLDASGSTFRAGQIFHLEQSSQSCNGWTYQSSTNNSGVPIGLNGLTVNDKGNFLDQNCAVPRAVACCARIIVVPEPAASLQIGTGILSLAALSSRAVCGS